MGNPGLGSPHQAEPFSVIVHITLGAVRPVQPKPPNLLQTPVFGFRDESPYENRATQADSEKNQECSPWVSERVFQLIQQDGKQVDGHGGGGVHGGR